MTVTGRTLPLINSSHLLACLRNLALIAAVMVASPARADEVGKEGSDNLLSLEGLLANPYRDRPDATTPLDAVRRRFGGDEDDRAHRKSNPEMAGTILVLRAVSHLNTRERRIAIDDAVRHMRKNPATRARVWNHVDTYRRNNPHMASEVDAVRARIIALLSRPPDQSQSWIKF